MKRQSRPRTAPAAFALLLLAPLLPYGCGGGAGTTLSPRAIEPEQYAPIGKAASPRDAYFAWKAAADGVDVSSVRLADEALSTRRNPFDADDPVAVRAGAVVYTAHCAGCHGANADGRGPLVLHPSNDMNFRRGEKKLAVQLSGGVPAGWFQKVSDGQTSDTRNPDGSRNAMPPMKELLSREQIWLALTYLEAVVSGKTPPEAVK